MVFGRMRGRYPRYREGAGMFKHSDEVKELAFEGYMLNDRNIGRTHGWLAGMLATEGEDDPDPTPVPTRKCIWEWAKREQWDVKIDRLVAERFPRIHDRQTARMVMQTEQAQDFISALLAGELDGQRNINAKAMLAMHMVQIRGLGTAAARADAQVKLNPQVAAEALPAGATGRELAARQRAMLESGR